MIYPFPWRIEEKGKNKFSPKTLYSEKRFSEEAEFLSRECKVINVSEQDRGDILILDISHARVRKRGKKSLENLKNKEAYFLDTTETPFIIASSSKQGIFYGIHTLLQLKNQNEWIKARIWDEPASPIRGMHLYLPSRENIPFFKKWLDLLSHLKYNTIFLEIGGGMEYKNHPEINRSWEKFVQDIREAGGEKKLMEKLISPKDSMHPELAGGSYLSQEEIRELVEYARSRHIEIIPEVQSLSHCYYLCCAHPEIAERKDDPYPDTYCPYHPDTYPLLYDVLEEVLDIFQPSIVHMGHDEWYHIGICPRCQGKSGAEILAYDLKKIHSFLSRQGVRMAIWGDKLMNLLIKGRNAGGRAIPEGNILKATYPAIERIPKDILILDWYWRLDPFSQDYFAEHGFEEIFGNFHPLLMWGSEKRLSSPNVKGGEISSWCEVKEESFAYLGIIQNVIFSANCFWWKNYADVEKERTYQIVKTLLPKAREILGGFKFPEGKKEIITSGIKEKRIKIGKKIKGIRFIHSSPSHFEFIPPWQFFKGSYPKEYLLGRYIINTSENHYQIPLIYWLNILHPSIHPLIDPLHGGGGTGNALLYYAEVYKEERDSWGRRKILYALPWTNPEPDNEVKEINIEGNPEVIGLEIIL